VEIKGKNLKLIFTNKLSFNFEMKDKYENNDYENFRNIIREKIKNLFLNIEDEEFVLNSIINEGFLKFFKLLVFIFPRIYYLKILIYF
jgi:hypothetical protein